MSIDWGNTTAVPVPMGGCQWCAGNHIGTCPRVKSIEFHPNGAIKRVEFHEAKPVAATWPVYPGTAPPDRRVS